MSAQPLLTVAMVRESIRQWLLSESSNEIPVFLEDENSDGLRPKPPYLALKFPLTRKKVGFTDNLRMDSQGNVTLASLREATAQVDCIGSNAWDILGAIIDDLDNPNTVQFFSQNGFSASSVSDMRDLSALETTSFRRRCQVDIDFYFANEIAIPVTGASEVDASGGVTGAGTATNGSLKVT